MTGPPTAPNSKPHPPTRSFLARARCHGRRSSRRRRWRHGQRGGDHAQDPKHLRGAGGRRPSDPAVSGNPERPRPGHPLPGRGQASLAHPGGLDHADQFTGGAVRTRSSRATRCAWISIPRESHLRPTITVLEEGCVVGFISHPELVEGVKIVWNEGLRGAMADFKLFTVDEANRTLPLVQRIVHDLLEEYPKWRQAVARFEILTGGARADWGETRDLIAARDGVTEHAARINGYLQELEAVGCVFKGFDAGSGGLPLVAGGPRRVPVLAAGRGSGDPLARAGRRIRRAASRSIPPSRERIREPALAVPAPAGLRDVDGWRAGDDVRRHRRQGGGLAPAWARWCGPSRPSSGSSSPGRDADGALRPDAHVRARRDGRRRACG